MPPSIPPLQPATYVLLPQRLISTLPDSPRAIGLYGLIARLYLITHTPIPLSTLDVVRYDPTFSRGAVLRAFERLVRGGWLIETRRAGRKTHYTPTWGRISGTRRPWRIDAPLLDRPRHVGALRLDRKLLDLCMGKLTPDSEWIKTIKGLPPQPPATHGW